jgi:ribosomal protein S15, bacterial/organelle
MSIQKKIKKELIGAYAQNSKDTGSPEVQVAVLTTRIQNLTEHFKLHKKDFHSRRGLLQLIGKRKRLISYLKSTDIKRYEKLITSLNIRK